MKRARALTDLIQKAKEITLMKTQEIKKYHIVSDYSIKSYDREDDAEHNDNLEELTEHAKGKIASGEYSGPRAIVQVVKVLTPQLDVIEVEVEDI